MKLISIFSKLDIITLFKTIISQFTGISVDDQITLFNLEFGFLELLLLIIGVLILFGILAQNLYNGACIQVRPLISVDSTTDYYNKDERTELWIKYIRHAFYFMLIILGLLVLLIIGNKKDSITNMFVIIFLYSCYLFGKTISCIIFASLNVLVEYLVPYPKEQIESPTDGNEFVPNPTTKERWAKFGQVFLSFSILVTPVFALLWNTLKPGDIVIWYFAFICVSFIIAVKLVDKNVLKKALKNIFSNPCEFMKEYIKQHLLILCGTVLNRKELEVYKESKDYYKYVGKVVILIAVFIYSLSFGEAEEIEEVEAAGESKIETTLSILSSTKEKLEKLEEKTGLNISAILDEIFSE